MRLPVRVCLAIGLVCVHAFAQTPLSDENAYNPIPSPDGKMIVAVRTGWGRNAPNFSSGRSNLVSELIVLDRSGRTLSPKPLSKGFVQAWTPAGLLSYRDWSWQLLSAQGRVLHQGRTCDPPSLRRAIDCRERAFWLSSIRDAVFLRQKDGRVLLMSKDRELSPSKRLFDQDQMSVSRDERYIAVTGQPQGALNVVDRETKTWHELGKVVVHPDPGWNWMQPAWDPWFAGASQLTFLDSGTLTVSSADGRERRAIIQINEPAGLAVPSPDGRAIAYATFDSRPPGPTDGSNNVWFCTGIWVVELGKDKPPLRLTQSSPENTLDLRWLDDTHLVFDRVIGFIPPKARLWMVEVPR